MKEEMAVLVLAGLLGVNQHLGAQQTTTNTNCNVNGASVNCTSTTQPPPQGGFWGAAAKAVADHQAAEKAAQSGDANAKAYADAQAKAFKDLLDQFVSQQEAEQENKNTVDFLYCRDNSSGEVLKSDGTSWPCADLLRYTKAFCLVNTTAERCNLARSRTEVEKAFKDLAAAFAADPKRDKGKQWDFYEGQYAKLTRWACMSFPDMVVPQHDGSQHYCPSAPAASSVPLKQPTDAK